jgi:hypothetical protein
MIKIKLCLPLGLLELGRFKDVVLTVREVRTICREQGAILASISGASD